MTAFPDAASTSALERAALAYHIATGRTLDDREAVAWALDALSVPQVDRWQRRAVEAMIPWLDSLPLDDDTRSRLGLDPDRPEWREVGVDWHRLYLSRFDVRPDAYMAAARPSGWTVYRERESVAVLATGPETGTAGMDAAEAALRRAGVLPEGVTVRRAVTS